MADGVKRATKPDRAPARLSRAEQARATRRRIVAAAAEQFVARGYGATLLDQVADQAGVAVQTVYFHFGNKRTLLKHVMDVAAVGDDEPVPLLERPRVTAIQEEADPHRIIALWLANGRQILDRVAPLMRVVRGATGTVELKGNELTLDFGNPRDALARAAEDPPEFAVVDLRMPDLSGLEVVRALNAGFPPAQLETDPDLAAVDVVDDHLPVNREADGLPGATDERLEEDGRHGGAGRPLDQERRGPTARVGANGADVGDPDGADGEGGLPGKGGEADSGCGCKQAGGTSSVPSSTVCSIADSASALPSPSLVKCCISSSPYSFQIVKASTRTERSVGRAVRHVRRLFTGDSHRVLLPS